MTDLVTLAIDGSVAAGTLGATFLTVYQLRRDHRERLARELAEHRKKQAQPFDEPMIGALKGARNIVIHSGKEPTENGQRDIMKYLKELHRAVSQ